MPIGRLPIKIGSDKDLAPNQSVYPPMVQLDAACSFAGFNITTGACASVKGVDLTWIPNFSTRFGALFDEYCVVGADLELSVNEVTNPQGVLMALFDEKGGAAPTSAVVNAARVDIRLDNNMAMIRHRMQWKARDYLDLQWTDIGTTTTPVYLKLWADPTTTGTSATTGGIVHVTGSIAFCFRGYKNH